MTHASRSASSQTSSSRTAGTADGRARHHMATEALGLMAIELLEQRGIDVELASQMGVTTAQAPDGGDDWIAIPYVRTGNVVDHKYRRVFKREGEANFARDRGGISCWWNFDVLLDRTLDDEPLVICEGELDALTVIQAGFPRTISVPNGAPSKPIKGDGGYDYLVSTLDLLSNVGVIILATDNDQPGHALLNDLAKRLGRIRCKFLRYPPECKDLNDVLIRNGLGAVTAVLRQAVFLDLPGYYELDRVPPVPDENGLPTGISGLGDHFRLRTGDVSVLTGVPGSGKTTLVNDIACRMAKTHGWRTVFASPEQSPIPDHRRALRTWFANKPESRQSAEELDAADRFINEWFRFVLGVDESDFTLEWMLDTFAASIVRHNTKLCVIDPWNEIEHAKPRDLTMTEYTGAAIRSVKAFARKWQVHVLIVAHPIKPQRGKDGSIPCPTLYDIADSAHWANKPDAGLVLHPSKDPDGRSYMSLRVVKSRYHDRIGTPGEAKLIFNPFNAHFEPA